MKQLGNLISDLPDNKILNMEKKRREKELICTPNGTYTRLTTLLFKILLETDA